jgi:hypothetical protein
VVESKKLSWDVSLSLSSFLASVGAVWGLKETHAHAHAHSDVSALVVEGDGPPLEREGSRTESARRVRDTHERPDLSVALLNHLHDPRLSDTCGFPPETRIEGDDTWLAVSGSLPWTPQWMWQETSRLLAAKLTATEVVTSVAAGAGVEAGAGRVSEVEHQEERGGGDGGGGIGGMEAMRLEGAMGLWEMMTCRENHAYLKDVVARALVQGLQAAGGHTGGSCGSDTAIATAAAAAAAIWNLSVTPAARGMLVRAGVVGALCRALEHAAAVAEDTQKSGASGRGQGRGERGGTVTRDGGSRRSGSDGDSDEHEAEDDEDNSRGGDDGRRLQGSGRAMQRRRNVEALCAAALSALSALSVDAAARAALRAASPSLSEVCALAATPAPRGRYRAAGAAAANAAALAATHPSPADADARLLAAEVFCCFMARDSTTRAAFAAGKSRGGGFSSTPVGVCSVTGDDDGNSDIAGAGDGSINNSSNGDGDDSGISGNMYNIRVGITGCEGGGSGGASAGGGIAAAVELVRRGSPRVRLATVGALATYGKLGKLDIDARAALDPSLAALAGSGHATVGGRASAA